MRFWDSSALVALLVEEADSHRRAVLLRQDPVMVVWWATPVDCESAIQRRLREGALLPEGARRARERLAELAAAWHESPPQPGLRTLATRLLRTHPLRAADSLQLAAALTLCSVLGRQVDFLCADDRLASAAEIENLSVVR